MPELKGFLKEFETNIDAWKALNSHDTPFDHYPGTIASNIHFFLKLIIVRGMFPDKFAKAVQKLITTEMSEQYI